jgi:hypothetical protein
VGGFAWTVLQGPASTFSVNGNDCLLTAYSSMIDKRRIGLTGLGHADYELTARVRKSANAFGFDTPITFGLRYQGMGGYPLSEYGNAAIGQLEMGPTGVMLRAGSAWEGSMGASGAIIDYSGPYSGTSSYYVKFRLVGDQMYAKAWRSENGEGEPVSFQLQRTIMPELTGAGDFYVFDQFKGTTFVVDDILLTSAPA